MVKAKSRDGVSELHNASSGLTKHTQKTIKNYAKRTGVSECIVLQIKSTISGLATIAYFVEFILRTLSSDHDEDNVSLSMVQSRSERTLKFYNIITNANGFFREEEVNCSSDRH